MTERRALPLALTLGEPAGIGPDLTIQIWRQRAELGLPAFYLIGDPDFIRRRAQLLNISLDVRVVEPSQAREAFARALPIVPLEAPVSALPGKPELECPAPPSHRSAARSTMCWPDTLRRRHKPSCQKCPLSFGLCRAWPYRISGQAGAGGHRQFSCGRYHDALAPSWLSAQVTIHLPLQDVAHA